MEPLYPLAIATLAIILGLAYLRRDRTRLQTGLDCLFEAALARMAAGEKGVRLDPPSWSEGARQVSAFNQIVAEREGRSTPVDTSIDRGALFRRLRDTLAMPYMAPDMADDQHIFVAIAEINRFVTLRRGIGFKLANNVLRHVGAQITQELHACEIGRVGRTSIEFAFRAPSVEVAFEALTRLSTILERRIEIDGFTFDLPISIGFADSRAHSIREELLDQAAAALAMAQQSRVPVQFADQSVEVDQSFDDLSLMRDLPRAMQANELELYYQPKLRSRTNEIDSAEALLRWFHPTRGQVATDRLIELAESTGGIRDLTEWVIAHAVADQRTLAAQGHDLVIYVNISGIVLPDADFAARALRLVEGSVSRIGFEITETAIITDPERALANLHAFAAAGLKIAIDDYGSGLSSLAYLKQLPANELKIDRMFISHLAESNRDPLLVRSSIDLAHALEMEVTAEGVDDEMVLALLRIMGCDLIQGYLISPPLPLAAFTAFVADSARTVAAAAAVVAEAEVAKRIRG